MASKTRTGSSHEYNGVRGNNKGLACLIDTFEKFEAILLLNANARIGLVPLKWTNSYVCTYTMPDSRITIFHDILRKNLSLNYLQVATITYLQH